MWRRNWITSLILAHSLLLYKECANTENPHTFFLKHLMKQYNNTFSKLRLYEILLYLISGIICKKHQRDLLFNSLILFMKHNTILFTKHTLFKVLFRLCIRFASHDIKKKRKVKLDTSRWRSYMEFERVRITCVPLWQALLGSTIMRWQRNTREGMLVHLGRNHAAASV